MLTFLKQNYEFVVAGLTGLGWWIDRTRLKRSQRISDNSAEIDVLRKIIEQQRAYTDALVTRIDMTEKHFEEKCKVMQYELDSLKRKLSEK